MSVVSRFSTFLENISLTEDQKAAGSSRRESVVKALNANYYGTSHPTDNSRYVGSWAKRTRMRPPRDVDVLFELPRSVYERYEARQGNRQSQLLQEVKSVLEKPFPNTDIKGDGPVVVAPFATYNVEIVPAFRLTSGQFWVCMTSGGGRYKAADYQAESDNILHSNSSSNGQTRDLVKMMKRLQAYCSVPLRSFWLELLSVSFLEQWEHRGKSKLYHDYMVRDFLDYALGRRSTYLYAPGTNEAMNIGDTWASKATTARDRAVKACNLEPTDAAAAGEEWQKIFGADIPKYA